VEVDVVVVVVVVDRGGEVGRSCLLASASVEVLVVVVVMADDVGLARRRRGDPVDGLSSFFSISRRSGEGLMCRWNQRSTPPSHVQINIFIY
jgi:hypothetical protein